MTLKISEANGNFCGKCVELDIYGYGKSKIEAENSVIKAVKMYVDSVSKEELSSKTRLLKISNLSNQKIIDIICCPIVSFQ